MERLRDGGGVRGKSSCPTYNRIRIAGSGETVTVMMVKELVDRNAAGTQQALVKAFAAKATGGAGRYRRDAERSREELFRQSNR